jgi:hypothetical protein
MYTVSEAFLDGGGISMSGVRAFDMPADLQMQLSATAPIAAGSQAPRAASDAPTGEASAGSSSNLPWLRRPMLAASLSTEMLSSLAEIDSSRHDAGEQSGQIGSLGGGSRTDVKGLSSQAHDLNAGVLVALLGTSGASRSAWPTGAPAKSHVLAPAVSVPFTLYQMQMAHAGGSTENPWGKDVKVCALLQNPVNYGLSMYESFFVPF